MTFRALRFALLAGVIAAAACAAPQTIRPTASAGALAEEQQRQSRYVLETRAADYRRVYDMAQRLSYANAEYCARQSNTIGVRVENIGNYHRDFRAAARELWSLDNTPSVIWVGEGSPAALAGLQARDRLLAVNGRTLPNNLQASRRAAELIREASDAGSVTLRVQRGAETLDLRITPQPACGYEFHMVDDDSLNAVADGRSIFLFRGMLRFARDDDELALILGHELAHNAMGHIEAARQNATMGAVGGAMLDILAAAAGVNTGGAFMEAGGDVGRMLFSQEFESEADYVGLYFMARAGYDIEGAEEFWRRMSAENPRGIRLAYTHPNNAQRFVDLSAARLEIGAKLSSGAPLRPRRRGEPEVAPPATAAPALIEAPPEPATPEPPAQDPLIAATEAPADEALAASPTP